MLVILKEPTEELEFNTVAVNINAFESIAIIKIDEVFQLVILKHFDGHFSNQSEIHHILDIFDTYKECLDLWYELLDALKAGDRVFDLRSAKNASSDLRNMTEPPV